MASDNDPPYALFRAWLFFVQSLNRKLRTDFRMRHVVGRLDPMIARELKTAIKTHFVERRFGANDAAPSYYYPKFGKDVEDLVAKNYVFFNPRSRSAALDNALTEICRFASGHLGYPIKVTNIRIWTLDHSSDPEAAANSWHRDNMPVGVNKIMCYLTPPSLENGTTEIELSDKSRMVVVGDSGALLLFDNNNMLHRGVPPQVGGSVRLVMEVTVIPAVFESTKPIFAGTNAQFQRWPWQPVGGPAERAAG